MKYSLFIKWWLFSVLLSIGVLSSYYTGIFTSIYDNDTTYICLSIFIIMIYCTFKCGVMSYTLVDKHLLSKESLIKINNTMQYNWFLANTCAGLGLLGTILGMSMMVVSIGNIDIANVKLDYFSHSMRVALDTTICGIMAKLAVECQNVIIERELDNV